MNVKLICIVALSITSNLAYSQNKDTIGILIVKQENKNKNAYLFDVQITNWSHTPICVLYSSSINLFYDPPQTLAPVKKVSGKEYYSMQYGGRDTLVDFESMNENLNYNYNGDIVLPFQEIKFRISLNSSLKTDKFLHFEYCNLPDFCYKDFTNQIFQGGDWYKKYIIVKRNVELPK